MSSLACPFSVFHGTWDFFSSDEIIEIMPTARTEMRDGKRTKPNPAGQAALWPLTKEFAPREMPDAYGIIL